MRCARSFNSRSRGMSRHRLYERLRRDAEELDRRIGDERGRLDRRDLLLAQCRALLGRPLGDDLASEEEALSAQQQLHTRESVEADVAIQSAKDELAELYAEEKELAAGILRYPDATTELKRAVEQAGIPAAVFADLLQVTDPEWQNAVEGWLNTQRFNVLVPEAEFQRALEIYNRLPAKTAGVGLPNLQRSTTRRCTPDRLPRSWRRKRRRRGAMSPSSWAMSSAPTSQT